MKNKITFQNAMLVLLVSGFAIAVSSCFFYKVKSTNKLIEEDVATFNQKQKFFILHTPDKVWHLKQVDLKHDTLFGTIEKLAGHEKYTTVKTKTGNRYKYSKNEQYVLNEIHIYSFLVLDQTKPIAIPVKDISKIEINSLDLGTTIVASTFATAGTGLLLTGVAVLLIALLKESCPFVYVYNGNGFIFCGEIYSGAIHKPLERDDYLPLTGINPDSGIYKIKITNEVKEIQYTNLAELLIFDHPDGVKVLIDKYGHPQTIGKILRPVTVVNLKNKDVFSIIKDMDSLVYYGDTANNSEALTDGVILTFNLPENIKNCKLLVKAKNSYWLDYSFGKFYDMFGVAYNKWQAKQDTAPKEELLKWGLDQKIPLSVYIMKNNHWQFVDYFNVIGPMAFKEDVLSIPIDSATEKPLKIKLEYGRRFWEIDYAALDCNNNLAINTTTLPIQLAKDEKDNDVSVLLKADDSLYYCQPDIGNQAILTFIVPSNTSARRTVILHSKGHYKILRDPSGIPDRKYLETFNKPGRFNRFSNELMNTLNNTK